MFLKQNVKKLRSKVPFLLSCKFSLKKLFSLKGNELANWRELNELGDDGMVGFQT